MKPKRHRLLNAIKVPESPFPGLRPFEPDESRLFFGRDEQVEKLMDKLARTRFLAVVGTSGSGKSSLVRAGLMPALHSGMMIGAGSKWRIALMRPSNDPIGNLARALNAPEVFGSDVAENLTLQIAIAEATLRLGSRGLIETVCQNVMPRTENLLVVVDQFEELFRFAREARKTGSERSDNDAAAFVKMLLEAVKPDQRPSDNGANIYVVLTMRSDFLGDCSQFWDLPEAINESQYLIPRLTRNQLREVIEGPVALGGGQIAPRLVSQLLNDITDNQDQLPILQHALMRTWDQWRETGGQGDRGKGGSGGVIDLGHYEAIGGMEFALSRHADEAYEEVSGKLGARGGQLVEKMFKALTEKGVDNRELRRPATLGELCAVTEASEEEIRAVIEAFRAPGRSFLMPPVDTPLAPEAAIDISHESLIRQWGRLKKWASEESESRATYLQIVDVALRHANGRAGLWGNPDLQIALEWREKQRPNPAWAHRYHPAFDTAMSFLDRSRSRRRLTIGLWALSILLLIISAVAVQRIFQRHEQRLQIQELTRVQEEKKRDAIEAMSDGLYRAGNDQFEGAILKFDEAIAKQRDYAPAYFHRGIAKVRLGRNAPAIEDFEKALTLPLDEKLRREAERFLQSLRTPSAPAPATGSASAERRTQLINEMFNDDRATRITATTALIVDWKRDPQLIPSVVAAARERRTNPSGVINTLVLLESLDREALREDKNRININALLDVLSQANPGRQTSARIRSLRELLRD